MNIIAIPYSLHLSIESWSFIEPPGWIIAVIPALWASSIQSLNGKKASDANTAPFVTPDPINSSACSIDCFVAQILFTWPGPIPIDCLSFPKAMPLDFTYLTIFHVNSKSSNSFSVGFLSVTTSYPSNNLESIVCTIIPPFIFFISYAP